MAKINESTTERVRHCAYCGHTLSDDEPAIERFGEPFCSGAHAEAFAAGLRAARIHAAAGAAAGPAGCAMPPVGQRGWKDHVKRGACCGAPLLVLLAVPLFWTGNATAATGGSILSVLAALACPLGMFFMMRAMGSRSQGRQSREKDGTDGHDVRRQ